MDCPNIENLCHITFSSVGFLISSAIAHSTVAEVVSVPATNMSCQNEHITLVKIVCYLWQKKWVTELAKKGEQQPHIISLNRQ